VDIIERCAHPHFRPLLHGYLDIAGAGDEPRPTDLKALETWWREYDDACRKFPKAG
jgi:acetyl-CoA hydrolase